MKSSRALNEKSGWMGLQVFDLAALGYLLVFGFQVLEPFGLELFSFFMTGVIGWALIQLRLGQRSKFIRDFAQFQIKRFWQWL
jgi:hypothetical protein